MEFKARWARYSEAEVRLAYSDFVRSNEPLASWVRDSKPSRPQRLVWSARFRQLRLDTLPNRGRRIWHAKRRAQHASKHARIMEAWLSGASMQRIGDWEGVSRQRIHQVVRRLLPGYCPKCRRAGS